MVIKSQTKPALTRQALNKTAVKRREKRKKTVVLKKTAFHKLRLDTSKAFSPDAKGSAASKNEGGFKFRFWFIPLGLLAAVCVVFLTSGIPRFWEPPAAEEIHLPVENSVTTLLYAFNEPKAGEGPETVLPDVAIPAASILQMLKSTTHKVKKGDTLSEVAKANRVSLGTLISFNNIQDVRKVGVGTELRIPNADGILYKVKAGDSLSLISKRNNVSLNAILDANNLDSSVIRIGQELFIPGASLSNFELKRALGELFVYPVRGVLSSPFGMRADPFTGVQRMHYGIDVANNDGTPIYASMDGKVASVGNNPKGFGKYVILQHQGGYQTLYAHLSKILVTVGQGISQKEKIGEMGNTGLSTGPHLHFSIYKNQVPVDPLKYLN